MKRNTYIIIRNSGEGLNCGLFSPTRFILSSIFHSFAPDFRRACHQQRTAILSKRARCRFWAALSGCVLSSANPTSNKNTSCHHSQQGLQKAGSSFLDILPFLQNLPRNPSASLGIGEGMVVIELTEATGLHQSAVVVLVFCYTAFALQSTIFPDTPTQFF